MNIVKTVNTIENVITYVELFGDTKKILLVLDIDDVVFSAVPGKIFVEDRIKHLISLIHPSRIVFLTARHHHQKQRTNDAFNRHQLIQTTANMYWQIICSPESMCGNSTKGESLYHYLQKIPDGNAYHIVFVDDLYKNIGSVKAYLDLIPGQTYSLFHYLYNDTSSDELSDAAPSEHYTSFV